jgi:hypothetical protein
MSVIPTRKGPTPSPSRAIEEAVEDMLDAIRSTQTDGQQIGLDLDDVEIVKSMQRRAEVEKVMHAVAMDPGSSFDAKCKAAAEARQHAAFVTKHLTELRRRLEGQANPAGRSGHGGKRAGAGHGYGHRGAGAN